MTPLDWLPQLPEAIALIVKQYVIWIGLISFLSTMVTAVIAGIFCLQQNAKANFAFALSALIFILSAFTAIYVQYSLGVYN